MQGPGTPSLDQLKTFLTVVETGSFAAAGRKLGRATSAISYAIANLESQLGVALFDRGSTRKPVLTEADQAKAEKDLAASGKGRQTGLSRGRESRTHQGSGGRLDQQAGTGPEHLAVGLEAFTQGLAQAAGSAGQQEFVVGLNGHRKVTWLVPGLALSALDICLKFAKVKALLKVVGCLMTLNFPVPALVCQRRLP